MIHGPSSDSGVWVQVAGELEFRPKNFSDTKNKSSYKGNNPKIDSQTMLTLNDLNITDGTGPEELPERQPDFVGPPCLKCMLKWPRCLCISESDWGDTATKQMQMSRTSSPYPDGSDKMLEKLEMEMDDELDDRRLLQTNP